MKVASVSTTDDGLPSIPHHIPSAAKGNGHCSSVEQFPLCLKVEVKVLSVYWKLTDGTVDQALVCVASGM